MFAQRIKALREQKGIYQIAFANDMEVTQGTVGNWETGKRVPNIEMIQKIANYFDTTTDYLLGDVHHDPKVVMLTRRLKNLPEEDRNRLIEKLDNTIDIYLKNAQSN